MQKVLEEQQNERPITTTSVFSLLPFLLTLRNIRHYELSACRKSCAEILCSRLKYIYDTYVARPSIKVGRLHRGCGGGPYGAETYGPPLRKRRAVFYGFERKCSLGFIGNSNFFFFLRKAYGLHVGIPNKTIFLPALAASLASRALAERERLSAVYL